MHGAVVNLIKRNLHIPALQLLLIRNGHPAVHPHRIVHPGNEEDQSNVRVGIHVLVGLEQPVAGHIGQKQMPVIQNLDESRLASFRRGVAVAFPVAGSHHRKGGVTDELLDIVGHIALDLGGGPSGGVSELL